MAVVNFSKPRQTFQTIRPVHAERNSDEEENVIFVNVETTEEHFILRSKNSILWDKS